KRANEIPATKNPGPEAGPDSPPAVHRPQESGAGGIIEGPPRRTAEQTDSIPPEANRLLALAARAPCAQHGHVCGRLSDPPNSNAPGEATGKYHRTLA